MNREKDSGRGEKRPPVVHMTEEEAEDLQRFRELARQLDAKEKRAVILRMLEKPDTP